MNSVKYSAGQWLARVMLALVAITGITFVASPTPALAACTTTGCVGLDPQAQGCSTGARSMSEAIWSESGSLGYGVELRYSPTCKAMWSRLTVDYSFNPSRPTLYARVQRQLYNNQQLEWQASGTYDVSLAATTGTVWTKMVADYSSGDRTRACFRFGPNGSWDCTGWQ
ncbi:MAG TPA: DUF2690 domain-containing protein [Actinoplanes sp.]|nr:DUF2690 domain-containing protein [Actinoplanes sp.]